MVGGAGWETVDEPVMRAVLDHRYDTAENTFVNIEWPAYLGTLDNSVAEASDDLYAHISTTDGPKIAVGASGSTFVMNEVMRRLAADPNPDKPSREDISFVIIGVVIPLISYRAKPIPVTPYDVIVVKGEYDGLAGSAMERASSAAAEVAAPVTLAAPVVVKALVAMDAPVVKTLTRATIRDQRGNAAAKVAAAAAEQVSDAKPARRGANPRGPLPG